ncbi:phosphoesterase PA-phosphatase related [Planoprotostelium fungivorum]|uniref:Phosphoesterase PA-phosphatase related n=1 Tax=Planoprotostelium fungivorum TaxID=1890364 RepID=A0A2P6N314_9EUKA|nr:phosphoesterase PA-phosphatase related [Planoprotostelium fungivorum]
MGSAGAIAIQSIISVCAHPDIPLWAFTFWSCITITVEIFVFSAFIFIALSGNKEALRFGLSMIFNLSVCFVLKYLFHWDRIYIECGGTDPSMPSGHAQVTVFTATYLFILWRSDNSYLGRARVGVACSWSVLVCISRIYLGYHRVAEVSLGTLLGSIIAIASHKFWVSPFIPHLHFLRVRRGTISGDDLV